MRAYFPVLLTIFGILLTLVVGPVIASIETLATWIIASLIWIGGVVAAVLGVIWTLGTPHEWMNLTERRRQIIYDRARRNRAHLKDENDRLADVRYARYSILVEPAGQKVKLVALEHTRSGIAYDGFFFEIPVMISWHATKTKKLVDKNGSWDEKVIHYVEVDPVPSEIFEKLAEAEWIVQRLEREAYAEALALRQATCVATAMQPPPASGETRAKLEVTKHEVERLLEESHT
jgi:hypothetical protein